MFRKPMRLEKWIAFDGAVPVNAAQAVATATADDAVDPVHDTGMADDADSHEAAILPGEETDTDGPENRDDSQDGGDEADGRFGGDDEGGGITIASLSIGVQDDDGTVDIEEEINGSDVSISYPKEGDTDLPFRDEVFENHPAAQGHDFYWEITAPDGGSFGLWDNTDRAGFLTAYGPLMPTSGTTYYAFDAGGGRFVVVAWNGSSFSDGNHGSGLIAYGADGSLRFHLDNPGQFTQGQGATNAVFRSIVFRPDTPGVTSVTGYDVVAYYKDNTRDGTTLFHDGPGGMYNPDTDGVTVLEKDVPGPDPDPDPELPPPFNPSPGGDDGGDGPDDGDDSGDGDEGDDPVLTYQEPDTLFDSGSDDDGGYEEAHDDGEPDVVVELESAAEDGVDSAAAAMAAELMHEVEVLLSSVQGDREVLLQSLTALQMEYLRRGFDHDGALRDFLRELFERGDREKGSVNRVIVEMRRQLGAFNLLAADQRDGMLVESLRELFESAERRSGEMAALSRALEAVVKQLGEWHDRGVDPDAAQARAVFARVYADAMAEWQEKAERLDPMGRELITASQ